jgi:hypothetical protein
MCTSGGIHKSNCMDNPEQYLYNHLYWLVTVNGKTVHGRGVYVYNSAPHR